MNDNQAIYVEGRGKSSSRVLSEPGGKRSICIGGWTEEELQKQREASERKKQEQQPHMLEEAPSDEARFDKELVDGTNNEDENEGSETEETPNEDNNMDHPTEMISKTIEAVSSNAFASGNGPNVLTGRPTSRVLAPPGGHTSIKLW